MKHPYMTTSDTNLKNILTELSHLNSDEYIAQILLNICPQFLNISWSDLELYQSAVPDEIFNITFRDELGLIGLCQHIKASNYLFEIELFYYLLFVWNYTNIRNDELIHELAIILTSKEQIHYTNEFKRFLCKEKLSFALKALEKVTFGSNSAIAEACLCVINSNEFTSRNLNNIIALSNWSRLNDLEVDLINTLFESSKVVVESIEKTLFCSTLQEDRKDTMIRYLGHVVVLVAKLSPEQVEWITGKISNFLDCKLLYSNPEISLCLVKLFMKALNLLRAHECSCIILSSYLLDIESNLRTFDAETQTSIMNEVCVSLSLCLEAQNKVCDGYREDFVYRLSNLVSCMEVENDCEEFSEKGIVAVTVLAKILSRVEDSHLLISIVSILIRKFEILPSYDSKIVFLEALFEICKSGSSSCAFEVCNFFKGYFLTEQCNLDIRYRIASGIHSILKLSAPNSVRIACDVSFDLILQIGFSTLDIKIKQKYTSILLCLTSDCYLISEDEILLKNVWLVLVLVGYVPDLSWPDHWRKLIQKIACHSRELGREPSLEPGYSIRSGLDSIMKSQSNNIDRLSENYCSSSRPLNSAQKLYLIALKCKFLEQYTLGMFKQMYQMMTEDFVVKYEFFKPMELMILEVLSTVRTIEFLRNNASILEAEFIDLVDFACSNIPQASKFGLNRLYDLLRLSPNLSLSLKCALSQFTRLTELSEVIQCGTMEIPLSDTTEFWGVLRTPGYEKSLFIELKSFLKVFISMGISIYPSIPFVFLHHIKNMTILKELPIGYSISFTLIVEFISTLNAQNSVKTLLLCSNTLNSIQRSYNRIQNIKNEIQSKHLCFFADNEYYFGIFTKLLENLENLTEGPEKAQHDPLYKKMTSIPSRITAKLPLSSEYLEFALILDFVASVFCFGYFLNKSQVATTICLRLLTFLKSAATLKLSRSLIFSGLSFAYKILESTDIQSLKRKIRMFSFEILSLWFLEPPLLKELDSRTFQIEQYHVEIFLELFKSDLARIHDKNIHVVGKLLQYFTEHEAQTLENFHNPIGQSKLIAVPPLLADTFLKIAWKISPELAIHFYFRGYSNVSLAQLEKNISKSPFKGLHSVEVARFLLENPILNMESFIYRSFVDPIMAISIFARYQDLPILTNYAMRALGSLNNQIVYFYVPQIVQCLCHDRLGFVETYILESAKKSELFCHQIIWNMKANLFKDEKMDVPNPSGSYFKAVTEKLVAQMDSSGKKFYEREFSFFEKVTNISGSLKPLIKKTKAEKKLKIDEEMRKIAVDPGVYLPSNPESTVVGIQYDSGRPLQSSAKAPFMATFEILDEDDNRKSQASIFKVGDDCRQDVLALQIISMCKNIFDACDLNIFLHPYRVVATAPGCGVIEVIPNSMSRDEIGKEKLNNILNFFRFKFGHEYSPEFMKARDNFVRSLAGYAVLSYILAVKDRHNGNIMLSEEGYIIHIDFGFILGISPGPNGITFEGSPFKFTNEMLQVLGGKDSECYNLFKSLCIKGFLAIRRYEQQIVSMAEIMSDSGLPCFAGGSNTLKMLRKRFRPDLDDFDAAIFMEKLITKAQNTFSAFTTGGYDLIQWMREDIIY